MSASENADAMDTSGGSNGDIDLSRFQLAEHIKLPQNSRLYRETQNLKQRINEFVGYQQANPKPAKLSTREEIDRERKVQQQLDLREKKLKAQLALVRTVYRQSVIKIREEKAETTNKKAENDALILDLHNLKYEEQSLRSEIAAAENYDHKYKKLPLIPSDEFRENFPQYADSSEHDLTIARIEQEYQDRVKLEERRQEKLKQKQKLIAEVKKSKDDLTRLDGMVEKFVEHFEPIRKVLATE
ncbi:hypothetical protein N0V90_003257 [Kalmusia sp. IMI 367209]|nr:hypothetical protein N0V90_003257 [Kalmusia sp. IMI 367209]